MIDQGTLVESSIAATHSSGSSGCSFKNSTPKSESSSVLDGVGLLCADLRKEARATLEQTTLDGRLGMAVEASSMMPHDIEDLREQVRDVIMLASIEGRLPSSLRSALIAPINVETLRNNARNTLEDASLNGKLAAIVEALSVMPEDGPILLAEARSTLDNAARDGRLGLALAALLESEDRELLRGQAMQSLTQATQSGRLAQVVEDFGGHMLDVEFLRLQARETFARAHADNNLSDAFDVAHYPSTIVSGSQVEAGMDADDRSFFGGDMRDLAKSYVPVPEHYRVDAGLETTLPFGARTVDHAKDRTVPQSRLAQLGQLSQMSFMSRLSANSTEGEAPSAAVEPTVITISAVSADDETQRVAPPVSTLKYQGRVASPDAETLRRPEKRDQVSRGYRVANTENRVLRRENQELRAELQGLLFEESPNTTPPDSARPMDAKP